MATFVIKKNRKLLRGIEGIQNHWIILQHLPIKTMCRPNWRIQPYTYTRGRFLETKKYRVNRLGEAESNTTFFHTTTLSQSRRNKIVSLQIQKSSWLYHLVDIKSQQHYNHYRNNYSHPTKEWRLCDYDHQIRSRKVFE